MPAPAGGPTPRSFKTSEIKSRILNVATPTTYIVKFTPPQLVQNFLSERGINYNTQGEDFELRCYRTSTPSSSFLTHAVSADYHGVAQEIPYRRGYENEIAMSFTVDNNYDIVEFFEGWIDYMSGVGINGTRDDYYSPQANYRMSYYDTYKTNMFLTKFEKDVASSGRISSTRQNKKALEYTFIETYPKTINSMELGYGSVDEFLNLDITFGYTRYVRRRIDINDEIFSGAAESLGSLAAQGVIE